MALGANEQFSSNNGVGSGLRCFPLNVQPKSFAVGSQTLARLTPVAFNTSTNLWVPWASGGANGTGTISGLTWPDPIVLDASDEVLGNVMLQGDVHFDDIAVPSGQTSNNMKTALRSGVRDKGIIVQGLDQFR